VDRAQPERRDPDRRTRLTSGRAAEEPFGVGEVLSRGAGWLWCVFIGLGSFPSQVPVVVLAHADRGAYWFVDLTFGQQRGNKTFHRRCPRTNAANREKP
jgi:hypothetical protein